MAKKTERKKIVHCCTTQHVICNHVQKWVERGVQAPIEATLYEKTSFYFFIVKNFFFVFSRIKKNEEKEATEKSSQMRKKISSYSKNCST